MYTAATERKILHLDLDTFFVSVERLKNKKLAGKPVIIGSFQNRGIVASCSYETRQFGVHSGMSGAMAKKLCPEAIFIKGSIETYCHYSALVTEILADQAPVLEKASVDEFYIDLTGMDKYFESYQWSTKLRLKVIKESGLPISFGLSPNKMISKIATGQAKPNGQIEVLQSRVNNFLDPLPISRIPMLGEKTAQILASKGIRKIGVLRKIPKPVLESLLGKNGLEVWKRANGEDESLVLPYRIPKSISTEHTFSHDSSDLSSVKAQLSSMTEKVAYLLRSEQKIAGCLTVKIRYADFRTVTRQLQLPYTGSDDLLIRRALSLFDKLYEEDLLIRLIGVRVSDLVRNSYQQLSLFEDTSKTIQLYSAIDKVKDKYGYKSVVRAAGLNQASHYFAPIIE